MDNIIITKDTAAMLKMLQVKLAQTDSIMAKMKVPASIGDVAKVSVDTGDQVTMAEHIVTFAFSALMLFFLYKLARTFTFGNWTATNPNPYKDETLGMPKGTLRGIITITLLYFTVLIELHVLHNPLIEMWTDKYITSFQMVLAFYFGSQVMSGMSKAGSKTNAGASESSDEPSSGDESKPAATTATATATTTTAAPTTTTTTAATTTPPPPSTPPAVSPPKADNLEEDLR